jgi:hypothetical protein
MITRVRSRARHRTPSPLTRRSLTAHPLLAEPAASVSRLVPFIIGAS